jgi:hypothetical protein
MTQINSSGQGSHFGTGLTAPVALRRAWACWGVLLAVPFVLFVWMVWHLANGAAGVSHAGAVRWFVMASAYLVVVVPGSMFWRGHLFRDYWLGRPVAPGKYVSATVSVGVALAAGGIFSLAGCWMTGMFMPNLIPAALALLIYAIHWPTGRAMVTTAGGAADAALYEEPT